jgi:hypothetical protein
MPAVIEPVMFGPMLPPPVAPWHALQLELANWVMPAVASPCGVAGVLGIALGAALALVLGIALGAALVLVLVLGIALGTPLVLVLGIAVESDVPTSSGPTAGGSSASLPHAANRPAAATLIKVARPKPIFCFNMYSPKRLFGLAMCHKSSLPARKM